MSSHPSLCAALQETAARVPDRVALRTRDDSTVLTWGRYAAELEAVARGLAALGLEAGGTLAIMLVNRPEFHVVDAAALHLGAAVVSIYNTNPADDIAWLVADAGARIVVTEPAFAPRVLSVREQAGIEHVIVLDETPDGCLSLDDVKAGGDPGFDFETAWRAVAPDDVACLIYTSGTTGRPKGVELSHGALLGNLAGMHHAIDSIDGARVVSFLPMAHIGERQFSHYRPMVHGFTTTCCPDPRGVGEYLPEVRPHYFFTPPRMLEKIRAALVGSLTDDHVRERRLIDAGLERVELEQTDQPVPDDLAREVDQLRAELGKTMLARFGLDAVAIGLTGSAPPPPDLIKFYLALGMPLLQAWGLSECGAFGAMTRPDDNRVGTVGKPIPGVELRLEEDGEILLRSRIVMNGYRNRPEATAEALDPDGWLHTGDVGAWDEHGNLRIIDRKKELIINAAGKNMSPVNIESTLVGAHALIGQACVIGNDRPYNVALLVLDPEAAAAWARDHDRENDVKTLVADDELRETIDAAVAVANEKLSRVEQIKRYVLLDREWLPAGDELTPTMKLKRKPIAQKYADVIDELYAVARA